MEHIPYGSACNAEEGATSETAKETADEHCSNVVGEGTHEEPDQTEKEGANVYGPPAEVLRSGRVSASSELDYRFGR